MSMAVAGDEDEPMMDINTTPLIDVMLVLLIMLIITIPPQTHAVKLDLPQNNPNDTPPPIDPVKNKLILSQNNEIMWNGRTITEGELVSLLQSTLAMKPEPELQFQPEEYASYDISVRVINIIKASGVHAFGFVGNEQYRSFNKAAGAPAAGSAGV